MIISNSTLIKASFLLCLSMPMGFASIDPSLDPANSSDEEHGSPLLEEAIFEGAAEGAAEPAQVAAAPQAPEVDPTPVRIMTAEQIAAYAQGHSTISAMLAPEQRHLVNNMTPEQIDAFLQGHSVGIRQARYENGNIVLSTITLTPAQAAASH